MLGPASLCDGDRLLECRALGTSGLPAQLGGGERLHAQLIAGGNAIRTRRFAAGSAVLYALAEHGQGRDGLGRSGTGVIR